MRTIFLLLLSVNVAFCQELPVGIFQSHVDVGQPKDRGDITLDDNQLYSLTGGGYNVWFGRDEFHFAYKKIKGDFILTANFELIGVIPDPHSKVGWMVRTTLEENATHVSAVAHADGLTVMQWRKLKGAFMRDPEDEIRYPKKNPQIIQLERVGNKFSMYVAQVGEPLQLVGSQTTDEFPDEIFVGLFACSHKEGATINAKIWNVRIDKPVPDNYNPDREGFLGSRLEILDVFNGKRKIIHESTSRFEAPNWMPDGKRLLFNEAGSLYKIPVEGGAPEKLNTGEANRNNNDHGISFDGKMLAISHHRDGLPGGGSSIYVLPLEGGTPTLVTDKTPSYWHGWNPNGKEVLYVAMRDGKKYDIYKKSIRNGSELQLTNLKGHVDGPEFSPDGKYIYYNGSQTGTMQLWRMKPDGTNPEQLTFDDYNNWFPHISPDGKWIAFISFPIQIDPDSHPANKKVMLRIMPLSGIGAPRVIAHLYGGQGTINVPSWSPNSKMIAFVSNSERK
jgi:TolB protein